MRIGIDCQNIDEFLEIFDSSDKLPQIFTESEIKQADTIKDVARYYQRLVGYYCVKEAVFKALKLKNLTLNFFRNISVNYDEYGAPKITINDALLEQYSYIKNFKYEISITHTKDTATAICLIEE